MQNELLIEQLNSKSALVRGAALKLLKRRELKDVSLKPVLNDEEITLNIHTYFSFSPYSPTQAAYSAYKRGVKLACVCDYATTSGVKEFFAGCRRLGVIPVAGVEITAVNGDKLWPVSVYGLSEKDCRDAEPFLKKFRLTRIENARRAAEQINRRFKKSGVSIDFDKDVLPSVKTKKGGTVTYKHIYYAFGQKLIEKFGQGKPLADFIRYKLCVDVSESEYNLLCDGKNPFYIYDLVLALRANLHFSSPEGLPSLEKVIAAISARSLITACEFKSAASWLENELGDDKARAEFEKFVTEAKTLGFNAVCLHSKNISEKTLEVYAGILKANEMLAIPLERIEYPRSKFESKVSSPLKAMFAKCGYAIAGNAESVKNNTDDGLFSKKTVENCPDFSQRLGVFAAIGMRS